MPENRLPDTKVYTNAQIVAGLQLAQAWYEDWALEDLNGLQLMEAIAIAARACNDTPANDLSICCC